MVRIVSRERIEPPVVTPPPPGSWGERYRTGVWSPNYEEIMAEDLEVIQGSIPKDIAGCYIRNTENPLFDTMDGNVNYHPFDGDGMLHLIRFKDGRAKYCNKFVRTKALEEERKAGRSLWAGLLEFQKSKKKSERPGWGKAFGKWFKLKDTASTDVVVHGGKIVPTWYACGEAYSVKMDNLETEGVMPWVPSEGISAHCKVDEATGELLFFNYGAERVPNFFLHFGEVDRYGKLTNYQRIPFVPENMAGMGLPHDMAFTKNYAIMNYFEQAKSWYAIIPRHGTASQVRWFEGTPTYVLHFMNAFEDGDDIVMDGYHMKTPEVFVGLDNLDLPSANPQLWRWRFNLKTGLTTEKCLDERSLEFGMINQRWQCKDYRYVYSVVPFEGAFMFTGIIKHDVKTGESWRFDFGPDIFGSESPVAPKIGGTDEDDAYVVSFVTDMAKNRSTAVLIDAKKMEAGPVCTILLPHRICSGTHGCWADDASTMIVQPPLTAKL